MTDVASASTTLEIWRRVVKIFPAWLLPFDMLFDPSTYRLIGGADFTNAVVKNSKARKAASALAEASPEALDTLAQIARVNTARTGDVFKAVAICYISLPLGLAALLSDAAPTETRAYVFENAWSIAQAVFALVVTPIWYFLGHWRAKQIAWTIELYRAGVIAPLPARR
jgi:hypothetical protein